MASLMIKHTPYLDFGARQFDPEVATWLAPDPLSTDYPSLSPYVYFAADPGNLVNPEGMDWFYYSIDGKREPTWNWRDEEEFHTRVYTEQGIEVVLKGTKAVAVFDGARYERLGEKNSIRGNGAITAFVTLYGPSGPDDISHYTGFTMTSDAEK